MHRIVAICCLSVNYMAANILSLFMGPHLLFMPYFRKSITYIAKPGWYLISIHHAARFLVDVSSSFSSVPGISYTDSGGQPFRTNLITGTLDINHLTFITYSAHIFMKRMPLHFSIVYLETERQYKIYHDTCSVCHITYIGLHVRLCPNIQGNITWKTRSEQISWIYETI